MPKKTKKEVNQNQPPNFTGKNGKLFLVRCFACDKKYGRENWAMAVAGGYCAWCGWGYTNQLNNAGGKVGKVKK